MLIVSSIVVWILTKIPFIGSILSLLITILGLGILITAIVPKKVKKETKKETKKENTENE